MAATMKTKRSARRRKTTRGSDRYDVVLKKFKKTKKFGGKLVNKTKGGKLYHPSHMVTPENPTYKGIKVIN